LTHGSGGSSPRSIKREELWAPGKEVHHGESMWQEQNHLHHEQEREGRKTSKGLEPHNPLQGHDAPSRAPMT
jgi:hypothetical protein